MTTDPKTTKSGLGFDRYTLNPVDLAETPDKHAGVRRAVTVLLGLIIVATVGYILWRAFQQRPPTGPAAQQFLASLASENQATAKYVEKAEFESPIRLRLYFDREVWDDAQSDYRPIADRELRDAFLAAMQAFKVFAPGRQLKILGYQGLAHVGEAEYFPGTDLINIRTPESEQSVQEQAGEGAPEGMPGSDGH